MEEKKINKSAKYLLIGVLVLFLSILGASVAYYLARVQGNLNGRAAGTELTINVEKLSTNANDDLIPLDNDLETLNHAILGYGNTSNNFDATKSCIDINGYSVCQIYHITLTNNGSVPLTVNGTVTLSGQNVPNIDCATMSNPTTVVNNNSCMGGNVFVSGDTLAANSSNDYYVMVYINNLDEPQTDSGEFNGTVTFSTEDGKKVKGRFTKPFNLPQHITNLYNNANKSDVVNNEITYHYATSVGLMNDRLGGTTASLDGGDIRYYGGEIIYYTENDGESDGITYKGNWEDFFEANGGLDEIPFDDTEGCLNSLESEWNDEAQTMTGYTSLEEFCDMTDTVKGYYKTIKNYIDIGDKYETDYELGNWTLSKFPVAIQTREQCQELIATLSESEEGEFKNLTGMTGEEFCSVTIIPVGTPILWRIIGVFDGKLKIIRDDGIGKYSFDTSSSDINQGDGINQWGPSGEYTGADLMKLLNPGYESNTDKDIENADILVNNSLYWNSGKGTCYYGEKNATTECDFTSLGLSEEAKKYIVNQKLYLGGFDTGLVYANEAYSKERGNNVFDNTKSCYGQNNCNDAVTRTTSWTGKVGLPYPSDVGYAADFRRCAKNLENYYGNDVCIKDNWMNSDYLQFISPRATFADDVMSIYMGMLYHSGAAYSNLLNPKPTLLLDSSVLAESGNGSKETPYVVAY